MLVACGNVALCELQYLYTASEETWANGKYNLNERVKNMFNMMPIYYTYASMTFAIARIVHFVLAIMSRLRMPYDTIK